MPELPEVTTVINVIKPLVKNKTISCVEVLYKNLIKSDYTFFVENIKNKIILDITRKGKFLKFILSENFNLVVHLRMEGKLFFSPNEKERNLNSSTSLIFKFSDGTELLFNDTRKFGVMYLEKEGEKSVLDKVGKDPLEIFSKEDIDYVYNKYKKMRVCLKESLLNQEIMSGIGNIYCDETLYVCKLSPFMKTNEVTYEDVKNIVATSREIMTESIKFNGATVSSFHAAINMTGSFQQFLKCYSHAKETCPICHSKFEKRFLKGRGTTFCPTCQKVSRSVCITGPIACGKSTVINYFKEKGFLTLSLDELVHSLYENKSFLKSLAKQFPVFLKANIINEDFTIISLKKLQFAFVKYPQLKKEFQAFLYPLLKEKVNNFLNENYKKVCVVEVPLLIESNMQDLFTIKLGVFSNHQKENLLSRNEKNVEEKLKLNENILICKHKEVLTDIYYNDTTIEDLKEFVDLTISKYNLIP